jgi:hypothetical protein
MAASGGDFKYRFGARKDASGFRSPRELRKARLGYDKDTMTAHGFSLYGEYDPQ